MHDRLAQRRLLSERKARGMGSVKCLTVNGLADSLDRETTPREACFGGPSLTDCCYAAPFGQLIRRKSPAVWTGTRSKPQTPPPPQAGGPNTAAGGGAEGQVAARS